MAEPITIAQLIDASEDAQTLALFSNADAATQVPRRLADPIETLEYWRNYMSNLTKGADGINGANGVDAAITSMTVATGAAGTAASVVTGGTPTARSFALTIPRGDKGLDGSFTQKAYLTEAAMIADKANIPANTSVDVTNDATSTKNGTYAYNGTVFTKSAYDPLTQAKSYADTQDNTLKADTLLKVQNVFATKALMTASTLPDGSNAQVNNDTVLVNNGFYKKTAGAWNLLKYNSDQTFRYVGNVTSITGLIMPVYVKSDGNFAGGQASWGYFKVNLTSRQQVFIRYPAYDDSGLSRLFMDVVTDGVTQRVRVYGELVDSVNAIYKVIIPTEYTNTATYLYFNNININSTWGADVNSVPIEIYLDEVTSGKTTIGIDGLKSYSLVDGGARNLLKSALMGTIEKEFGGNIFNSTMTKKVLYVNNGEVIYSGQANWSIGLVPYDKNSRYFIENPDIASSTVAKAIGLINANITEAGIGAVVKFVELKRVSPFSDIYEIIIPLALENFVAKSITFNMFSAGVWEDGLTPTNIKIYKDYVGGSFQGDLITQYDSTGFIDAGARKELGLIQDKLIPVSRVYKDKTIMTFGDSLTLGTEGGYQKYLQHLLGAKTINYGRNGALAIQMSWVVMGDDAYGNALPVGERVAKDFSIVDVVTIMIGTNDFGQSTAYWDSLASIPDTSVYTKDVALSTKDYFATYSTGTFASTVAKAIEYIKYKNPSIQVFLISSPHQTRDSLLNVSKHRHVYKGIAEKCGAIYLDATDSAGLSRKEISQWSYDAIHLNAFGNKVFGTWLAQKIASVG